MDISALEATRRSGIFKLLEQREEQHMSAFAETMKSRQALTEFFKSREAFIAAGISINNINAFSNLRSNLRKMFDSRDSYYRTLQELRMCTFDVNMAPLLHQNLEEENLDEEMSEQQPSYIA